MKLTNGFLVVLLLLSSTTLSLAKPRWVFIGAEDGERSEKKVTREVQKSDSNVMKDWRRESKRQTAKCPYSNCT